MIPHPDALRGLSANDAASILDQVRTVDASGPKAILIRAAVQQRLEDDAAERTEADGFFRALGSAAEAIGGADLPETLKGRLLDALAGLVTRATAAGDVRDAALEGIGSLVGTLEDAAPRGVGKTQVMEVLTGILLDAAKGRFSPADEEERPEAA